MSEMVTVRAENGDTVQVNRVFAESKGLEVLNEPESARPDIDPKVLADHTLVRVKLADGSEATTSRSFAAIKGLKVLDKEATDRFGVARNAKPNVDIRGKELNAALEAAGLPTSGTLAERQARLADHQESSGAAAPAATTSTEVSS